jgi:hypothetical protein
MDAGKEAIDNVSERCPAYRPRVPVGSTLGLSSGKAIGWSMEQRCWLPLPCGFGWRITFVHSGSRLSKYL